MDRDRRTGRPRLFLALTGRDGAPNSLQEDGVHTDFPFNGYFTSVTVE